MESQIVVRANHYNALPIVKVAADRLMRSRYWCDTRSASVLERVLRFHYLFDGKSKWVICVGSELREMHYLYMCLWHFLHHENSHYFPGAAMKVCHYLHVHRIKLEPKYTIIDFGEAAKAMENWVGIEPCPRLLI